MKKNRKCIIIVENINFISVAIENIQFGYDLWKLTQKEYLEKINGQWYEEIFKNDYFKEVDQNIGNNYLIKYEDNNIGWLEYELYKDYIYIIQLHIMPEYQNKGIGTNIINELIKYGKNKKKDIYLEVLQYNEKALNYYYKMGFKKYTESSLFNSLKYEIRTMK